MAILEINVDSKHLNGNTRVQVIMPSVYRDNPDPEGFYRKSRNFKVLYLLHGTYGDSSDWVRRTTIEPWARDNSLAIVMPSALNSNFANWPRFSIGYNFRDFFFEELMPMITAWFPVSEKREDTFLAGLSMGGWGATMYALTESNRFAASAMLSGFPLNTEHVSDLLASRVETFAYNYPDGMEGYLKSDENIWRLTEEKAGSDDLPQLYFSCGQDDFMYKEFLEYKAYAERVGLQATFEDFSGYGHEWPLWEKCLKRAMSQFWGLPVKD